MRILSTPQAGLGHPATVLSAAAIALASDNKAGLTTTMHREFARIDQHGGEISD